MKALKLLLTLFMLTLSQQLFAATVTDTVEAPDGYFLPDDGTSEYDETYYRDYSGDWSWTHSAISGEITSATLTISAFDVDYLVQWANNEVDVIYAYDASSNTWIELGVLSGTDDDIVDTTFVLDESLYDDIANGLQILIDIDSNNDSVTWAVTLLSSTLTVETTAVPLPASVWLFGSALVGFFGFNRSRKKAA